MENAQPETKGEGGLQLPNLPKLKPMVTKEHLNGVVKQINEAFATLNTRLSKIEVSTAVAKVASAESGSKEMENAVLDIMQGAIVLYRGIRSYMNERNAK